VCDDRVSGVTSSGYRRALFDFRKPELELELSRGSALEQRLRGFGARRLDVRQFGEQHPRG